MNGLFVYFRAKNKWHSFVLFLFYFFLLANGTDSGNLYNRVSNKRKSYSII